MLILNLFSFGMISQDIIMDVKEINTARAASLAADKGTHSAVGHQGTAAVFSDALGVSVPCVRHEVKLKKGDSILLGNYRGPLLCSESTEQPEGSLIRWFFVEFK